MNQIFMAAVMLLAAALPAGAAYEDALKASEALNNGDGKELTALLEKTGDELAVDPRALQLLRENRKALELFRQAAAEPGDGYLLAPKAERPVIGMPVPKFGPYIRLFRLLLIAGKVAVSDERPQDSEKDLLAAAGFIAQAAGQKSAVLYTQLAMQVCFAEAWPQFQDSLRGNAASPAYMAELARRLDAAAAAQDFMRLGMLEDGEMYKNTVRDSVDGAKMAGETDKLPLLQELLMRRIMDDKFASIVDRMYSGYMDAQVKAYTDAFAANDPALAAARIGELRKEAEAQRVKYPPPGFLTSLVRLVYPGQEAREAAAFSVYEKFLSIEAPDYGKLIPPYHAFYNALNALRAGLAVKRYQRDSRRLPPSLDQLVPAYLPAVPADTFNKGLPLAYLKSRNSFRAYSFGPDGADGGGREPLDLKAFRDDASKKAGDILFEP